MPFTRRMRPLPLSRISITDPFWSRWQTVLIDNTLPAEYDQLKKTGRLENFERVVQGESNTHEGRYFNDSDVYKWLEAAAYALALRPDLTLRKLFDKTVDLVLATQEPTGYINTYFQLNHPDLKFRNLGSLHEMYCGGHLI